MRGGPDGAILAARAPDARRAPASITKLMTVLVALEHVSLNDVVTITPESTRIGESGVQLRVGERLTVKRAKGPLHIAGAQEKLSPFTGVLFGFPRVCVRVRAGCVLWRSRLGDVCGEALAACHKRVKRAEL